MRLLAGIFAATAFGAIVLPSPAAAAPAQAQPEAAPQPAMIAQPSDERMPIDAPKFSWFPSRGATPPADARQEEAAMRATDERHPDNSVTVLEAPESPEAPAQP